MNYDIWKLATPPEYEQEPPEPCACCGVHDSLPDEEDADEDGRYMIRHDLCGMCESMSCDAHSGAACHCHSCGRRGVETCYPDATLCVDCDAFRERSAAWFAVGDQRQRNASQVATDEAAQ